MDPGKSQNKRLKIVFVGAGWVGGTTSCVFASKVEDHDFWVYDISEGQINKWKSLSAPIYEQGLEELLKNRMEKNLFFTSDKEEAFKDADYFLLCVNTPTKQNGTGKNEAHDLKYIEACTKDIAIYYSKREMIKPIAIVEKSTVGPRTCELVSKVFSSLQPVHLKNRELFCVLSNPEFLAEGVAIDNLSSPDRVIIGSANNDLAKSMCKGLADLYARFIPAEKIITTSTFTAELSKLASNAFLAQRISSINSLTPICETLGIDIQELSHCIGSDTRIGSKYLQSSPGYGGSCLEKDLQALVFLARTLGLEEVAEYWNQVNLINAYQKRRVVNIIVRELYNNVQQKSICLLGVAFKKNTNDSRGTCALTIVKHLHEEGASIRIYDPQVKKEAFVREYFQCFPEESMEDSKIEKIQFFNSVIEASEGSSVIVILTEWDEFKDLQFKEMHERVEKPCFLLDCRQVIDIKLASDAGFTAAKLGSSYISPGHPALWGHGYNSY